MNDPKTMRRAAQLVSYVLRQRAVRSSIPNSVRFKSTKPYNVSKTVLDIEAMNHKMIKEHKEVTFDDQLLKIRERYEAKPEFANKAILERPQFLQYVTNQDGTLSEPNLHELLRTLQTFEQFNRYAKQMTERDDTAQWLIKNATSVMARLYKVADCQRSVICERWGRNSGLNVKQAQDFINDRVNFMALEVLDNMIDLIEARGMTMGVAFCAAALRLAAALKNDTERRQYLGHYLEEIITEGYELDIRGQYPTQILGLKEKKFETEYPIVEDDDRAIKKFLYYDEKRDMHQDTELREDCFRDVIGTEDKYRSYLQLLLKLNATHQLQREWEAMHDSDFLAKPDLKFTVTLLVLAQRNFDKIRRFSQPFLLHSLRRKSVSPLEIAELISHVEALIANKGTKEVYDDLILKGRENYGEAMYKIWGHRLDDLKTELQTLVKACEDEMLSS